MTTWSVAVRDRQLRPGAQLDFGGHGLGLRPGLADGDGLDLTFTNDAPAHGTVLRVAGNSALIEVSGVRWRIRVATRADNPLPPPLGASFVSRIVETREVTAP
jgi:hypothetical protein